MPHRAQVDADGFALWLNKRVQPCKALKVILDRGALIEGRVLDGYSPESIAGATVEVFRPDRGRSPLISQPRLGILDAETDEEGFFRGSRDSCCCFSFLVSDPVKMTSS